MLDDPEKSIDLLRAKSISIRGERGEWSEEWVVVEVGQEELTSATLKRKKKEKRFQRSCKGLMDYVTRTLIVAITVHKRKVVYIYIIIMTHKHMRISMRYLGCKVGNRS